MFSVYSGAIWDTQGLGIAESYRTNRLYEQVKIKNGIITYIRIFQSILRYCERVDTKISRELPFKTQNHFWTLSQNFETQKGKYTLQSNCLLYFVLSSLSSLSSILDCVVHLEDVFQIHISEVASPDIFLSLLFHSRRFIRIFTMGSNLKGSRHLLSKRCEPMICVSMNMTRSKSYWTITQPQFP